MQTGYAVTENCEWAPQGNRWRQSSTWNEQGSSRAEQRGARGLWYWHEHGTLSRVDVSAKTLTAMQAEQMRGRNCP